MAPCRCSSSMGLARWVQAEAGLALTAEAAQLASEVSEAVDAQACSLLRGGCRTSLPNI